VLRICIQRQKHCIKNVKYMVAMQNKLLNGYNRMNL